MKKISVSIIENIVTTYPEKMEGWRHFRIEYGGHAEDCIKTTGIWLPPEANPQEIENLFIKWQE